MAFDVTVQPIGAGVPDPEEGSKYVEAHVVIGAMLPLPVGPGQPPPVLPIANIRVPFTREVGIQFAEQLRAACEKLPKESNLTVASDLSGVSQLADLDKKLR